MVNMYLSPEEAQALEEELYYPADGSGRNRPSRSMLAKYSDLKKKTREDPFYTEAGFYEDLSQHPLGSMAPATFLGPQGQSTPSGGVYTTGRLGRMSDDDLKHAYSNLDNPTYTGIVAPNSPFGPTREQMEAELGGTKITTGNFLDALASYRDLPFLTPLSLIQDVLHPKPEGGKVEGSTQQKTPGGKLHGRRADEAAMRKASGGLMSLAHGGRPGFQDGTPSLGDWLSTPFLSEGESTFDKMKKAGSDLIKAKNLGQYQDISSSYTQPVTYEDSPVFQAGLENWDATGLGSLSSKIINKIVPSTLAMASPFDSGFLKGGLDVPPKEDVIAEYSQWNEPEMAQALGEQAWANAFGHEVSHLGWQYKPDREEWETESRAPGIGKDKGEEQWNYMHDLMYGPRYDEETFGRPGEDYLTTKGLINKGDLSYTPEAFDLIAKSRLIPEHKRAIGFGINPFEDTSRGYYRSPYQKSIAKYGTQEGPPGTKGGSTTKTNLANFAAQAKALEKVKDPRGGGAQAGGGGIGSTGHGRGGHHFAQGGLMALAQGGRPGFKDGSDDRPHKNIGKYQEAAKILKIDLEALSPKELSDFVKRVDNLGGKAQGGRIGYARGRVVHPGGYAGDDWGSDWRDDKHIVIPILDGIINQLFPDVENFISGTSKQRDAAWKRWKATGGKAQGGTVQRYFGTGGIANLQSGGGPHQTYEAGKAYEREKKNERINELTNVEGTEGFQRGKDERIFDDSTTKRILKEQAYNKFFSNLGQGPLRQEAPLSSINWDRVKEGTRADYNTRFYNWLIGNQPPTEAEDKNLFKTAIDATTVGNRKHQFNIDPYHEEGKYTYNLDNASINARIDKNLGLKRLEAARTWGDEEYPHDQRNKYGLSAYYEPYSKEGGISALIKDWGATYRFNPSLDRDRWSFMTPWGGGSYIQDPRFQGYGFTTNLGPGQLEANYIDPTRGESMYNVQYIYPF